MHLNLRQIEHFIVLARTRSYTRASAQLNMTQPALTRSIQALEKLLCAKLFDRSRSGAHMTAAGREMYALAQNLLKQTATLQRTMEKVVDGSVGNVSFGMAPLSAQLLLSPLMRHLNSECPHLHTRIEVCDSASLERSLVANAIEFAVCADSHAPASCILLTPFLYELDPAILVRRNHPLAKKRTLKLEDAIQYPLITSHVGVLEEVGTHLALIRSGAKFNQVNSIPHLLEAVLTTDTISIGTPLEAVPKSQRGQFKAMGFDRSLPLAKIRLTIIGLPDRKLSSSAEVVIRCLKSIAAPGKPRSRRGHGSPA